LAGFIVGSSCTRLIVSLGMRSCLRKHLSCVKRIGAVAVLFSSALASLPAAGRQSPSSASPVDRYVSTAGSDANDGSPQHPWATITHAGSLAKPGMTIHIAPGIYTEAVDTSSSGSAKNRISYVSDTPGGAIIIPTGQYGFAWKNTGNYSNIIGFEIAGTRCGGIGLGGSFQSAISNNVHNTAAGCNTSDGGSGINDYDYKTQANDILKNYVHDVGITEPACGQLKHNYIQGIYQANAGGHIGQNISANNCGFGIHLWHAATHATIVNNTVVGNKSSGILIGSGDAPCSTTGCPGGNDYTVVRNNIVAYNGNSVSGGWGLGETAQDPGLNGPHNDYGNNLSFQNVTGDFYLPNSKPCRNCITGQDPKFVSLSFGDYHLKADSPAISAGQAPSTSTTNSGLASDSPPRLQYIGALPVVSTQTK
jgi:hypothetical protein